MALTASRFLDPKADIVFKKIFGQHADLLKSFLNAVMPLPGDTRIEKLTYLTPEQVPEIPEFKRTIVDVKCTDQYGRIFIVEMQMESSTSLAKRIIYGVSQAYVQQLKKGEHFQELSPVYGLAILNDIFEDKVGPWFHHYRMQNVEDAGKILEGLEIVIVELPKFQPATWVEKRLGVLWLRFLREIEGCVRIPQEFEATPELVQACELAQEAAYSPAELDWYQSYRKQMMWENTRVEDGRIEGELQAKRDIACALIADGFDDEKIAKLTSLSLGDIIALRGHL